MFRRAPRLSFLLLALVLVAGCQPRGLEALRRGDELLRAGQTAEAITHLERAATDLPSDARVWNHLGLAYHASGRNAEALKSYVRALEKNRDFFDAWFNLGALRYEEGNWPEAERALRTYLAPEANRTNAVAWRLLGLAQWEARKLDDADRSLANATRLAPRDPEAWNGVGLLQLARKRPRDAQKTFTYVTQIAPDFAPARLNLAVVTHQHLNDRRGALAHYRAYVALQPAPSDVAAVEALIRQLDPPAAPVTPPPTAPAPAVPTNAVAAKPVGPTNLAARIPTNAPLGVRTTNPVAKITPPKAATNPPTVAIKSPEVTPPPTAAAKPVTEAQPKPATPAPKPQPEPEVVRVPEGPTLVPARDVVAASPPATPKPVAPSVPVQPQPTLTSPVAETNAPLTAAELAALPEAERERRGFWSRANPAKWNWRWANPGNWFDGDDAKATNVTVVAKAPTPLDRPAPRTNPPAAATRTTTLPLPTATPTPPPARPKPVLARYTRRYPNPPAAGNRAAAQGPFDAALAAQDKRDLAGASELYEQAVLADPSFFAAQHNFAAVALERNDVGRALPASEAAVALQPDSLSARRLYAAALQRANYAADAAEQLERISAAQPDDVQVHLALAGLYAAAFEEPARARPHYERVLALAPNHPQAPSIRIWLAGNR